MIPPVPLVVRVTSRPAVSGPETVRLVSTAFVRMKSLDAPPTAMVPTVPIAFAVPTRDTGPPMVPLLNKVAAVMTALLASLTLAPARVTTDATVPKLAMPFSAIVPAPASIEMAVPLRTAPVFSVSPPVPDFAASVRPATIEPVAVIPPVPLVVSVTSRPAVSGPETVRPVLAAFVRTKSLEPPDTANAPIVPIVLLMPARFTVAAAPVLTIVPALIRPAAAWVTPPAVAFKLSPVRPNAPVPRLASAKAMAPTAVMVTVAEAGPVRVVTVAGATLPRPTVSPVPPFSVIVPALRLTPPALIVKPRSMTRLLAAVRLMVLAPSARVFPPATVPLATNRSRLAASATFAPTLCNWAGVIQDDVKASGEPAARIVAVAATPPTRVPPTVGCASDTYRSSGSSSNVPAAPLSAVAST